MKKKLIAQFTAYATAKGIDTPALRDILKEVLKTLIEEKFGNSEKFHIVVNSDKGDLQIWRYRTIIQNGIEAKEGYINLSEARKISSDFEIGEEVAVEFELEEFGRRAIARGMQLLVKLTEEVENNLLYKKYKKKEGYLVYGEVFYSSPKITILQDENKIDLLLPKANQIGDEYFPKGAHIHALISEVLIENDNVKVILDRSSSLFLQRLLENQIAELSEGIVKIKQIVRKTGKRSKVIVSTEDDRVDPVGACIGTRGSRIRTISNRELNHEPIDIIGYTDNYTLLIKRILGPVEIDKIDVLDEQITAYLKPEKIPFVIGAEGQNIRLASQILGKTINLYSEKLIPFSDILNNLNLEEKELLQNLQQKGFKNPDSIRNLTKEQFLSKIGENKKIATSIYEIIINTPHNKIPTL